MDGLYRIAKSKPLVVLAAITTAVTSVGWVVTGIEHIHGGDPPAQRQTSPTQRGIINSDKECPGQSELARECPPVTPYVDALCRPSSWAVARCPPRPRYLISVSSLNIGRYMEMITMPTMTPTPSIMIGSTIEVRAWTEASTSSS